ncbi:MAG: response regulator [Epsilonproteobacteria bacterium]|nr:response regulator [Campylobacterota bacterium]
MSSKNSYRALAKLAKDISVLYVEDNVGLRKQASKIFRKFFKNIYIAEDGEQGIVLFKQKNPDIVITDIRMPKLDGLEMSKQIKDLNPDAKILITSAFDDKEKLLECIKIGTADYLKKPILIDTLVETLYNIIISINEVKNRKLFDQYVGDSFEYQDDMLMLVQNRELQIVNKKCLDFFMQKNIDDFRKFFENFSKVFIPHKDFLSCEDSEDWLEIIKRNSGKLHNTLIKNAKDEKRHFVLKATKVPNKDEFYIISFNDITELGLLEDEDTNLTEEEQYEFDKKRSIHFLQVIKRNRSKIKLFNSYKGLSISNAADLIEVNEDKIRIKTTYLQQRALYINKKTIIESEILSKAVVCELDSINFETNEAVLKNFTFTPSLPSFQEFVRVEPEETSTIEIMQNAQKINVSFKIAEISIKGCNISALALPARFQEGASLMLKIVIGSIEKPLQLNLKGKIFKTKKREDDYEIVILFDENVNIKKLLTDYVAKRQMALIREFKGLQNAK